MLVSKLSLLLRRVPRALEGGPSERQHLLWVSPDDSDRDISVASACGSSLHSGYVGSAAESSKWAYALRSGVCSDRRRTRKRHLPDWR